MKSQKLQTVASWQPLQSPCWGRDVRNWVRGRGSALPRGLEVGVILSGHRDGSSVSLTRNILSYQLVNCVPNPLRTSYFLGTPSRDPWTSPESRSRRVSVRPNKGLPDPQGFTTLGQCPRPFFAPTRWGVLGTHPDPLCTRCLLSSLHSFASLDLQRMPVFEPRIRYPRAPQQASFQRVPNRTASLPPPLPASPHPCLPVLTLAESCFTLCTQALNSRMFLSTPSSVYLARSSSKAAPTGHPHQGCPAPATCLGQFGSPHQNITHQVLTQQIHVSLGSEGWEIQDQGASHFRPW